MWLDAIWQIKLGNPEAGGLLLLDWTDRTGAELSLDGGGQLQQSHGWKQNSAQQIGRGNLTTTLAFERIVTLDTEAAAKAFVMAHALAIQAVQLLASQILSIRTANADGAPVFLIGGAVIAPGFKLLSRGRFVFASYTILGGKIAAA